MSKRELIDTSTDKRYVRRDDKGRFNESDDVGRSLSQDVRKKANAPAKPGRGDRGDRRPATFEIAEDPPDRYLINMAKNRRTGRIFLVYLRNDRMSTAMAPLSPRARPGATVSMPLTWSQVRSDLDPKRFTIRTTPALLAKSTAWDGYCDAERPLADAMARLSQLKAAA